MQSASDHNDTRKLFDFDTAGKFIPGGPEAVVAMAKLLVVEVPKSLQQIREGLGAQDARAVQRAAHTLKGSANLFAASAAAEAAYRIEELAKNDRLENAERQFVELETEVLRLVSAVRAELDQKEKKS